MIKTEKEDNKNEGDELFNPREKKKKVLRALLHASSSHWVKIAEMLSPSFIWLWFNKGRKCCVLAGQEKTAKESVFHEEEKNYSLKK